MSQKMAFVFTVGIVLSLFSAIALSEDMDGDGMSNSWELQYGLDPNDANDAETDLDSDSYSNLCEFLHNSEPNNVNSEPSSAITIHVPAIVSTVHGAISACIDGDSIVLAVGTYYGSIVFDGAGISITSTDPNDPAVVAATIIDANSTSLDVVTVNNQATGAQSVWVEGLTLTGGRYGINASNIWAPHNITFFKCRIVHNHSYGVYGYGDVLLENCILARNTNRAIHISSSTGVFEVVNCTVVNNGPYGIVGAGIDKITNSIIWGNGDDLYSCSATYSCIEDIEPGEGNIHANPLFINDANDDYRLWHTSGCVDSGDPNSDYSQEPGDGGGQVNMGAYGNTPVATVGVGSTGSGDSDNDGMADAWELIHGLDPNDPSDGTQDLDGDGLRNIDEYHTGWDPNSFDTIDALTTNERTGIRYPHISMAIASAQSNDTLILSPDTYYGSISLTGKPLTLRSTDPNYPAVVAATIIDANSTSLDVVTVNNHATGAQSVRVEGLTLTGGRYGINASNIWAPHNITFSKCRIVHNHSYGVYGYGDVRLENCILARNTNRAIHVSSSTGFFEVVNCTVVNNGPYGIVGAGIDKITNSIIWGNGDDLYSCSATYSCIEDIEPGEGNIHSDPQFIDDANDDYCLWHTSGCVDSGDPNSDYSQEPGDGGGQVNMGAYGNTPVATVGVVTTGTGDSDGDGMADVWEQVHGLDPNDPNDGFQDLDGDGLRNIDEYHAAWDPNAFDSIDALTTNTRTGIQYPHIGMAIASAQSDDTLVLSPDTYYGSIVLTGKPLTLRSTDPNDPAVVAATIIDANSASLDVVTVNNQAAGAQSVRVEGLTLTGGRYGINASNTWTPHNVTFSKCRIVYNHSYGVYGYGDVLLENCILARNTNRAIHISSSTGVFEVVNCTVVNNGPYGIVGAGIDKITNSIIWGNGDDLYSCSAMYSCIEDIEPGAGNIHANPLFINDANDNYRLWHTSGCVDSGDPNSDYSHEPGDGGGQVNMGAYGNTLNAATGVGSDGTGDSDNDGMGDAWEIAHGLDPNDPSDGTQDLDGDGLRNIDEYHAGWDPNAFNTIDTLTTNARTGIQYPHISMAIASTQSYDTLVLAPGTYYGSIVLTGTPLTLRSMDPNDPAVVAATIIDANSTSLDVVTVNNQATGAQSVRVEGLTLTGGRYGINASNIWAPHNITFSKCRIVHNHSYGVYGYGDVRLENCILARNTNRAIHVSSTTGLFEVVNCTVVNNGPYGIVGAGIDAITNSIVWGNGDDLYSCSATYSCIEDIEPGVGNIHSDPLFIDDANDDYRLWYISGCVDSGDPNSDYSQEPGDGGGRVNRGAYGNTLVATVGVGSAGTGDSDGDGMADTWELIHGLDPNDPNDGTQDLDGDGLRNIDEYHVAWDPNTFDAISALTTNERTGIQYPHIGMAIELAQSNDTLVLSPGTYYESIVLTGKPLTLRSTDPNDSAVVAATIIDANSASLDVVTVNNQAAGAQSVRVEGLTLTGGRYGINSSNNWAPHNITVTKCRIVDNHSFGTYGYGDVRLENCILARNTNRAIHVSSSTGFFEVVNCTVVNNGPYGIVGAGIDKITNNIIWGNGDDLYSCSATYSCIEDIESGEGNIHSDPLFINDANDDYHLPTSSPCVNAGDPNSDYSQEPGGGDGRINMGAYGNTSEAAVVDSGSATTYTLTITAIHGSVTINPDKMSYGEGELVVLTVEPDAGYCFRVWSGDISGIGNSKTITITGNMSIVANFALPYYVSPYGDDAWDGTSPTHVGGIVGPKQTINAAIYTAGYGSIIKVDQGTYNENIDFQGKDITLSSYEPNNWDVVAGTVIRGDATDHVVTFSSWEGSTVVLQGLTIQNGGSSHAGIYCSNTSSPLISQCVIENNYNGILCDTTSPSIQYCIVRNNTGIGINAGSAFPLIHNCAVYGNDSGLSIAGAATIAHTTITGNTKGIDCLIGAEPTITNCIVYSNLQSSAWANSTVTYSCIEGGLVGVGNLTSDPMLTRDYHIELGSPCINRGSIGNAEAIDIDGEVRAMSTAIDIGADEVPIDRIYVNCSAVLGGNGSSWSQAYRNLQDALAAAESGNQIWVAQGTYKPTTTSDRRRSFDLKSDVTLLGGFLGDEIRSSDRDSYIQHTILSGDIDTVGSNDSYHVVKGADRAVLDGFVITHGNANGTGVDANGGGVLNLSSAPMIRNCVIIANQASGEGGGLYNENCTQAVQLSSCSVIYNTTGNAGGGVYNNNAKSILANCILWGNTANMGISVVNTGTSQTVASYCDIQGSGGSINWDSSIGTDGGNNSDSDPSFADYDGADNIPGTQDDDYAPGTESPCMSSGIRGQSIGAVGWDDVQLLGQVSVNDPVDLCTGEDRIYVLSATDHTISVFDDQLAPQTAVFSGGVLTIDAVTPRGMCLDDEARIYIADTGNHRVLRYTAEGVLDTDFAQAGVLGTQGSGPGQFESPHAIQVDNDGQLFVSDAGNHRVQVFDSSGTFVALWGQQGTEPGDYHSPGGFAIYEKPETTLLVADRDNHRLQWISGTAGSSIDAFGSQGRNNEQFASPSDVWYDSSSEHIFVADTGNDRIQILEIYSQGIGFRKEVASLDLSAPSAVACINKTGNEELLIADTGNNRVLKVSIEYDLPTNHPLYVYEEFKNSLRADDVNTALSFTSEMSREDYGAILQTLQPHFEDLVNGMGQMELEYQTENTVLYEMLHDEGGGVISAFPVYFIRDMDGNWKIDTF